MGSDELQGVGPASRGELVLAGDPGLALLAERLVDAARSSGVQLTGPGGLLTGLTKQVLETALQVEMADHLGYDRDDPSGRGSGNSRNGSTRKRVRTDIGEVDLQVPRDRAGTFAPVVVPKHVRRLAGFDEAVISLYAKGMTTGDIANHLADVYGTEVSRDLVSKVTDAVLTDMNAWASRPLDPGQIPANEANHLRCRRSHRRMAWSGVASSKHNRGRSFSSVAMSSSSDCVHRVRSVPLGRYWRSRPLVFSFVGRCHGE